MDGSEPSSSIWEVTHEGKELHMAVADALHSYWTPDGEYFIFHRKKGGPASVNFWAVRESSEFFGVSDSEPVMLRTAGLMGFPISTITPDGKTIITVGVRREGQLMKYDSASGHWLLYLGGLSANWLDFSRDGQWVIYVDFKDMTLWRSRNDGSHPKPLAGKDMLVISPKVSPDGTNVAFLVGRPPGWRHTRLYLVEVDGGEPKLLLEAARAHTLSWSSDGTQLVFDNSPENKIKILDLKTKSVETVPGSEGLYSPRWSPGGEYLVALTTKDELVLYNSETGQWPSIVGDVAYPEWSRKGKPWVYFVRDDGAYRVRITDGTVERLTGFDFELVGGFFLSPGWIGLTPDDTVVTLRRVSAQEVYALDLETP
jgi:Tol biopolymer transport system component